MRSMALPAMVSEVTDPAHSTCPTTSTIAHFLNSAALLLWPVLSVDDSGVFVSAVPAAGYAACTRAFPAVILLAAGRRATGSFRSPHIPSLPPRIPQRVMFRFEAGMPAYRLDLGVPAEELDEVTGDFGAEAEGVGHDKPLSINW